MKRIFPHILMGLLVGCTNAKPTIALLESLSTSPTTNPKAPIITVSTSPTSPTSTSSLTLSGTCSDPDNDLNKILICIKSSGSCSTNPSLTSSDYVQASCTGGTFSYSYPTSLADASYNISVYAIDKEGNLSTQTSSTHVVDTVAPTISNVTTSKADGLYGTGEVINIEVTISEEVFVTNIPSISLNSGGAATYSSGTSTSTLTFQYIVGNGQNITDLDYSGTEITLSATTDIKDKAGNSLNTNLPTIGGPRSLGGQKSIAIDSVAPALPLISLLSPASSPGNSLLPTFRITNIVAGDTISLHTDSSCNLASQVNSITAGGSSQNISPSTNLTEGITYTFYAKATDSANNSSCSTVSETYSGDTTPPNLTITSPASNSEHDGNSFLISGACETGLTVSISGDITSAVNPTCTSSTYSTSITLNSTDGSKTISVSSTDTAGNTSSLTRTFIKDTIAPTSPSISINSGAVYSNSTSVTLSLSATGATDMYVTNTAGCASGGTWNSYSTSAGWSLQTANAVNMVYVKYKDAAGNESSCVSDTITHDNNPPNLSISSPSSGSTWGASVTINGTCENGITVNLTGDLDTSYTATCSANVFSKNVIFSATDGNKNITVSQTDAASNTTSINRLFVSDTQGPIVSISLAGGQSSPTTINTIEFDVDFGEEINVSSFTIADITNLGTATLSSWSINDTGDHRNFTISTTANTPGTIIPKIPASLVSDNAGNTNAADSNISAVVNYTGLVLTVDKVYSNNGNWNDYVKYTINTNPFSQSDTACTGSETGYYGELNGCIHGGEKRKVIVSGYSTCTNLDISDSLGVFDWTCLDDTATAIFYTKGLKKGKGLRDLITSGGAWKGNSVDVKLSGSTIGTSSSIAWWTNPITQLPGYSSDTLIWLYGSSTIYYTNTNINTSGYATGTDKISIVTLGSSKISFQKSAATGNCDATNGGAGSFGPYYICGAASTTKFHWIEANLEGFSINQAKGGILASKWNFSRINNTAVTNVAAGTANEYMSPLYIISSSYNLITSFSSYNSSAGVKLNSSSNNIFRKLDIATVKPVTNSEGALTIENTSPSNRFYDVSIANVANSTSYSYGIFISSGLNNVFQRLKVSNISGLNGSEGFKLFGPSSNNTKIVQSTFSNTNDAAFFFTNSNFNIISHATTANTFYNSIYFNTGSSNSNNSFNSILAINSQKVIQSQGSGSNNLFRNLALSSLFDLYIIEIPSGFGSFSGYLIKNSSDGCYVPIGPSCSGITSGGIYDTTLSDSIIGQISSDDTTNQSDTSGLSNYSSLTSLTSWLNFENPFRLWGRTETLGLGASAGYFGTGVSTQIWDLRAKPSGHAYNRSFNGNTPNTIINIDGNDCTSGTITGTVGNISTSDYINSPAGISYLQNAIEIDEDGIGNDNGLCESGESCVWAPNIGAYQGTGAISTGYCVVSGNGFSTTKIYKYTTN